MMRYPKKSATTIIACLVLFAGCVHTQKAVKKNLAIPVNLPGMGGVIPADTQKAVVSPVQPVVHQAPAVKKAEPTLVLEGFIPHEGFSATLLTKSLDLPAPARIMSDQAATKPAKSKNNTVAKKATQKPSVESKIMAGSNEQTTISSTTALETAPSQPEALKPSKIKKKDEKIISAQKTTDENKVTASSNEQIVIAGDTTVAELATMQPEAAKQPLLPPTPEEIAALAVEEDKPTAATPKKKSNPAPAAAKVEEKPRENKSVEQNQPEVYPEADIKEKETEPTPQSKSEPAPEAPVEKKAAISRPAEKPAEEKSLSGPIKKPSVEERQQVVRKKLKEEEEKKKQQRSEESKRPARMHTVVTGDTLPLLAEKYYKDKNMWWKIYDANKDKIEKGSLKIDQSILIP